MSVMQLNLSSCAGGVTCLALWAVSIRSLALVATSSFAVPGRVDLDFVAGMGIHAFRCIAIGSLLLVASFRFSGMVRIRVTYEPSGHADIGSAIRCAKAPPAPTLQGNS